MNTIESLYNHLQSDIPFTQKYPAYSDKTGTKILFVSPVLDADGIYKMIIPAMELSKYKEYNTIITGIQKHDINNPIPNYDRPINTNLVRWADYINLPFTTQDLTELIQSIRKINSDVEISMHVDIPFWMVPEWHPLFAIYSDKAIQNNIINNIKNIDLAIMSNKAIKSAYLQYLTSNSMAVKTPVIELPAMLGESQFEGYEFPTVEKDEKKARIGIIGNVFDYKDMKSIEPVLAHINSKHGATCEIILFGYNGDEIVCDLKQNKYICAKTNFMLGKIEHKYYRPVGFFNYYEKIHSLGLDIVLIPSATDTFSITSRNHVKFLELSAMGIPCVLQQVPLFEQVLDEAMFSGILCDTIPEWTKQVDKLILNKQESIEMGKFAQNHVRNNWTLNQSKIAIYTNIFPLKSRIKRQRILI